MVGALLIASQLQVGPALAETDLGDLPISEIPVPKAAGKNAADPRDQMIIFFSGDGWASFLDNLGHDLAKAGLPVVEISSTSFFATEQSPDSIARAIETVFAHYSVLGTSLASYWPDFRLVLMFCHLLLNIWMIKCVAHSHLWH